METGRFHGVMSLGLTGIAVVLAAIVLFSQSVLLGAVYLVICVGGSTTIITAYCAKCPCKSHCGHVFPGKAAMLFNRQPGPYTRVEVGALLIALALIMLVPLPWLWPQTALFVAYWVLIGTGVVEIRSFVCRACDNVYCPLKRAFQKQAG